MVELWTDNSLPSAMVGSNLCQVWCINRSVEETLCYNSNCRMQCPFEGWGPKFESWHELKVL